MLINVPQYIDVEDKIVGPITAKQLGWLIALGIILLIMWNLVPGAGFFVIGLPLTILFLALAFFRPYGQPLGNFIFFGILYYFRPKVYIWRRAPQNIQKAAPKFQTEATVVVDKHLSQESLRNLAQLLDSEGSVVEDGLESILKQAPGKK